MLTCPHEEHVCSAHPNPIALTQSLQVHSDLPLAAQFGYLNLKETKLKVACLDLRTFKIQIKHSYNLVLLD